MTSASLRCWPMGALKVCDGSVTCAVILCDGCRVDASAGPCAGSCPLGYLLTRKRFSKPSRLSVIFQTGNSIAWGIYRGLFFGGSLNKFQTNGSEPHKHHRLHGPNALLHLHQRRSATRPWALQFCGGQKRGVSHQLATSCKKLGGAESSSASFQHVQGPCSVATGQSRGKKSSFQGVRFAVRLGRCSRCSRLV